ncbi:MAG: heparin lyase I family protein [Candidatus Thiodiazotropha sp.]
MDGFESGDLSSSANGVSYGGNVETAVSTENSLMGDYSLRFTYPAAPNGSDSFSEQRMNYPQTNELWIRYNLYVPTNYVHRTQSGAANNKFLAVYKDEYRYPGFQVNWSLSPDGSGGSNLSLHRYRNGSEQRVISPSNGIGVGFITQADRGKWIQIVARIKAPSSQNSSDGVMQMWKDGEFVTNETTLDNYGGAGENYMDELYLLGWSNSGFSEQTVFYIDDLHINDGTPFVQPSPPTLLD